MNTIWNEENIRKELARLDKITRLHGADIPIRFGGAKKTLGSFSWNRTTGDMRFTFSRRYFNDPQWPDEVALDTIRHEYAHYMDHMLNGGRGHGSTWKQCCVKVGANPVRCYDPADAEYYVKKHQEEDQKNNRMDAYRAGVIILHPKYSEGTVQSVQGDGAKRIIYVDFPNAGTKHLALNWVEKNCRIVS